MRRIRSLVVAASIALAGVLAYALWPGAETEPSAPVTPIPVAAPAAPPEPAAAPEASTSASTPEQQVAEREVTTARARRAQALSDLAEAEAAGEQLEREVEKLERFIADLEERGEDPTQ